MARRLFATALCSSLLHSSLWAPRADADPPQIGSLVQFNDNGAWSWFQDERAIIDPPTSQLLISSIASDNGVGGAPRDGDVDVVAYNFATGASSRFTLIDFTFTADDHNSAAFVIRPDGRYLAMYAAHQNDSLIRWRISTNPGDATSWNAEQTLAVTSNQGTTYSNPFYLSSIDKVVNLYRGNNYDPHLVTSTDSGGGSFTYTGHVLMDPANSSGQRPYLKYASNGVDRIYFITSEAHPRDLNTGIYAGYLNASGQLFRLDGTNIGSLGTNAGAVTSATAFTTVLAPNQIVNGTTRSRAWTTDVALDGGGNPYMLFTSRNGSDSDHRFYYARWNGSSLTMTELAKAGGFLYAAENDYTGLGALHPNDPNTLYISTKIDPRDGLTPTSRYEIYRGFTHNGGLSWTWTPITAGSTSDNLRPIMPKWDATHSVLVWFQGTYTTYQNFNSAIVGKFYEGANGLWNNPAGGAWEAGANWVEGRIGSGLSNIADFSIIDYSGQVDIANGEARTLGFLTSGDANVASPSNLVIGGQTLTLNGGVISPQINVKSQTTTLNVPLAGTQGLTKAGPGSLVLGAANTYTGTTLVIGGTLVIEHPQAVHGSLTFAGGTTGKLSPALGNAVVLSSLSVAGSAQLDLADNDLVIDYTGAPAALENGIREHLLSGRIHSSSAGPFVRIGYADNVLLEKTTFGGVSVDDSSLLLMFTYAGDTDLDGDVDVNDLGRLASSWQSTAVWTGGDFDYNGAVNVNDLGLLASNWQAGVARPVGPSLEQALASVGLPAASVPEPMTAGALLVAGLLTWRAGERRRGGQLW
jgi:autotransporter-associated beta strand protein